MENKVNTDHINFQAWYKANFPSHKCRIQNLIGTYSTLHADNEFVKYCERLPFEDWMRSEVNFMMFDFRYSNGDYDNYKTRDLYKAFKAGMVARLK